ncbi:heme oxygenase 1, chloroplastic-like [Salvia miltiorrhiza]|uniref:heme oxygenase 1, chloroplastic-like n=1 Tax=Salvia miltiorrhiza TaxID=226208 RepID=UPI0025AC098F|nr:heme oxygenase 1, chloroplastic-like [Salvia miltiorrhiza]
MASMISLFNRPPQPQLLHVKPQAPAKKWRMVVVSAGQNPRKKLLAEEMKMAAMKLHKIKPGEKEPAGMAIASWEPTLDGYLRFLADTKLIYEALENIVDRAVFPQYAELRKTGLERSERIAKDMEWFEQQGHLIPHPSSLGINYAEYLNQLSENEPHAFLCHFYMTYFGHTAGGTMIGRKVEEKILNGKELEFYKYEGDLPQLLQNVRDKLNTLGEGWSREEKDRCLEEFQNSFNFGGDILRLVLLH